jgi:GNAT superfamily N-acetyltransferase
VEIRYARPADVPALAALRGEWGVETGEADDPAFRETFRQWVGEHAPTHTAFVAEDGGEVVGMAFLADLPRPPSAGVGRRLHGDLQSVYVRPGHRDRGVGTLLVARVVAEARRRGMTRLTVQSGTRAVTLYERAGFAASPLLLRLDL